MNASIALQILPLEVNQATVIAIVDKVIAYIQSCNVHYEVGAFETTMEGDLTTLLAIVEQCVLIASAENDHIFTNVKINYHPQGVMTIEEKTQKHRI